jgi:tetratricopeptide (TPR) repeat protein
VFGLGAHAGHLPEGNDTPGAIQVFKLNAETFPDSSNVWDSLGESYLKAGDFKKAQENYEKALSLDPASQSAKEALKKIKESQQK